jgi:hypothetical protein
MAVVVWEPAALAAYEALPSGSLLLTRVNDALDLLERAPGARAARRRALRSGGAAIWIIELPQGWALMWAEHPDQPETIIIAFLGASGYSG